jgi:hypothetical protein
MLLALAPTPSQFELLQALNEILQANGRSLFRDIEVGRGPYWLRLSCQVLLSSLHS